LEFLPQSNHEFITCGVQHMSTWKYNGGILNFEELRIKNPFEAPATNTGGKKSQQMFEEEEEGSFLKITFLAIVNIFNNAPNTIPAHFTITAGDDGYLYVWKDYVLASKKEAHKRIAVLCLSLCDQNVADGWTRFVSGGVNGTVILWQMEYSSQRNVYELIKLKEYAIYFDEPYREVIKNPQYHIQSLQFRYNLIVAGTRSGDIYFLNLVDGESGKGVMENLDRDKKLDMRDVIKRVFTCHDNEIPKEADFSENCDRIFCITEKGLFSSTDFDRLEQLVHKEFKKNTVAMIVFKKHPLIFIAFEYEVLVLDVSNRTSIEEIRTYSGEFLVPISDMKVSANEKILAIALAPSNEQSAKIEIYSIDTESKKLISKHTIPNISSK
jgi:hypothetical protein